MFGIRKNVIKISKEAYEKNIKRLNDLENERVLEIQKKWDALKEEAIKKTIFKKGDVVYFKHDIDRKIPLTIEKIIYDRKIPLTIEKTIYNKAWDEERYWVVIYFAYFLDGVIVRGNSPIESFMGDK